MKKRLLLCLVCCCVVCILISCCFRIIITAGKSMEPTYHAGDVLLCIRRWREPAVGDVIVFSHNGSLLVKRVAAVAGQTPPGGTEIAWMDGRTIPDGYVYVLGDNPQHSFDSRKEEFGLVPIIAIWGYPLR